MNNLVSMDQSMKDCIDMCNECRDTCESLFYQHCLTQGGKHVAPEHARLMADCVQACETAAQFMLRESEFHMMFCNLCAEVCEACANSCFAITECEKMQQCGEICQKCANSCRDMATGLPSSLMGKIQRSATQANLM